MTLNPDFLNLLDASTSVGVEDETKYLRNEVVEHIAVVGILELLALRTICVLICHAT